jgi:phosphate transport system substrate-binding protein
MSEFQTPKFLEGGINAEIQNPPSPLFKGGINTEIQNPPGPLCKGGINARLFFHVLALIILALSFASCSNKQAETKVKVNVTDEVHIDSITMYCDDGFKELMDQELEIYELNYPNKHIHMLYTSETEVLKHLNTDSFSVVILGRRLREQERMDIYHKTNLQAEERTFAIDAVALIANPKLDRNTLAYNTILSLLTNSSHEYDLVFEGNGSGVINYMFAQIARTSARPSAYAAKNTAELVDYLQKDRKAIGFIPFSRISDENDTTGRQLLKKVKVLYVSKPDSTGHVVTATASQSEIADGSYPLDRPINFISHSLEDNIGTGFANFLFKEQSGRIILKAGLVPAMMPQRVINVNTEGLKGQSAQ